MARRTTKMPTVDEPSSRKGGRGAAAVADAPPAPGGSAAAPEPTGFLGGKLYPPAKLKALEGFLARRGVKLLVGDEHVPPGKAGGFSHNAAGGPVMILRGNPTQYMVWHEMAHFLHYQKIGAAAYDALPRTKEFHAPEQFVFDFLENNKWDELNEAERQHAIDYIESVGGFR